ncbi:MAG: GNAT family N-acetyltransferase [Proteobacteria bacterium]|nr:GNAT family N-acetyltransferase [Pseudomonadota bacterium]
MSNKSDDMQVRRQIALRDGTPAIIRPMRPDDRGRIVAAFAQLDPNSIYTRYFTHMKALPERALNRLKDIDFEHLAGLAVTIGCGDDEVVIGSSTYVVFDAPDGAKAAEVAFTIEEDYQGNGLAKRLLETMIEIARRHRIVRFEADVLAGNAAMLAVFGRCGLPMRKRRDGGVTHIEMDLAGEAAPDHQ